MSSDTTAAATRRKEHIMSAIITLPLQTDNLGYVGAGQTKLRVNGRTFHVGWAKDGRQVNQGPIVPGWHGWMNQGATVITAHREQPKPIIDAELGQLVTGPEDTCWRIERNPRAMTVSDDYLTLVKVELYELDNDELLAVLVGYDDDDDCEGHESLAGEHMGQTVFCDGSCKA